MIILVSLETSGGLTPQEDHLSQIMNIYANLVGNHTIGTCYIGIYGIRKLRINAFVLFWNCTGDPMLAYFTKMKYLIAFPIPIWCMIQIIKIHIENNTGKLISILSFQKLIFKKLFQLQTFDLVENPIPKF